MTSLDPAHIPHHLTAHGHHHGHHAHTHSAGVAVTTLPGGVKVPDLRFEQGYLKAISPYVPRLRGKDENAKWEGVAWVTLRDQLLSPLLQGMVLGAASSLLYPLFPVWRKALFGKKETPPFPEDKRPPLPGPVPMPWWRTVFASLLPSSVVRA